MSDTIDLIINADDGWVAIATNPIGLNIKSNGIGRWRFAAIAGSEVPDDDLEGEIYESLSSRYVKSFVGVVYVKVDTDESPFSITPGMGAVHTVQSNGVPNGFSRITTNTLTTPIAKGQLAKSFLYPRIGNEHVESSREVQSVVTSGNIVGQIFRASKDNTTGLLLTLESAAGVVLDNFEDYANSAALQAVWMEITNPATLELTTVRTGLQAMSLPTDTLDDEWTRTVLPQNYTGYTGTFAAYSSHSIAQQQISVFIGDSAGNTKSLPVVTEGAGLWCACEVNEAAMVDDQVALTDVADIVTIGYRVILKRLGGTVIIDDLASVPPPGEIEIKLWDMGVNQPESAVTSIDDGTVYPQIGVAQAAGYALNLQGGKRLYNIKEFICGANKSIPTNEILNVGNYYILELMWVDTDVNVYGPDVALGQQLYNSGYAFTAPDEATPIAAIGELSDLMFGIVSAQTVYLVRVGWRFDFEPGEDSSISVYIEGPDHKVADVIVDQEEHPEQEFPIDLRLRPVLVLDGGKLEYYYNDDFSDSVQEIHKEMQFLYEPPIVYG